ncbi:MULTISPECIES: CorA family divalent cation transporter [Methylosinus]|uniref:Magnesium transporter CorA n=1 Tax=Methylosinus trichosporium (strain ATCC 35070 / NCIMB 11131 / UNIQEM 75 / OB3b) TaxID=595536 RepID=A0A2D2D0M0_METT3|nr:MULTISPECIES: CorA family divalent cation transporter [Methylosinus]ATQ68419.1 magnesium transporter CorA [Methylosinus trichosporium OB3b]OBS51343.1 magnesium transporter CorA [Methylosinus sp. 3S-1]
MKLRPPRGAIVGDSPFLWVLRFDAEGAATLVSPPDAPSLSSDDGGFVWVHLNVADLRYRDWVAAQPQIPEEAKALLVEPDTHQRLAADESSLWGVLPDRGRDLERPEDVLRHLRIAVTAQGVVTARRYAVQSSAAVRQAALAGARITSPLDLFEQIVEETLAGMDSAIENLFREFNEIEDRVLDDEARDERRRLGGLRRQTIRLHREIADAQRVFARAGQSARIGEAAQATLRRLSQRFDSLHQELEALQDRARLLQDEIVSNLTAETNRQLYVLTILGTLLMPPTLVSGIFGMNTKNLFFAESENGTLYAAALCVASAASALLALAYIRKRGAE